MGKTEEETEMCHGQWCLSSRCTANHMRISGARKGRLSKWRGSHSRTWPALTSQHGINPIIFSHTASGSCYTGLFSRNRQREETKRERKKPQRAHQHIATLSFEQFWASVIPRMFSGWFSRLCVKVGTQCVVERGRRRVRGVTQECSV